MNGEITSLPVEFTVVKEYASKDDRFLEVTIDVLHDGKNFNGSIFEKETVDKYIDTIKNTPILGKILVDENGESQDFEGHEYESVKVDGKIKFYYAGQAYGVIPESCNPRWVSRVSSDGMIRDYLRVDGVLWTKFERAIEIFQRDEVKGQSMELSKNFKGYEDEDGYFVFTEFSFDGCCILSTTDLKIQPAMIDSNISTTFSSDSIATEIKEKLTEYNRLKDYHTSDEGQIDNITEKGGNNEVEKKAELLEKYSLKEEDLDFSMDEISEEDFEEKLIAFMAARNNSEKANTDFSLNTEFFKSLRDALYEKKIYCDWGVRCKYCYVDFDNEKQEVYAEDAEEDFHLYGFPYSLEGDKVIIDFENGKRKKFEITDYVEGEPELNFMKEVFDNISEAISMEKEAVFSKEKSRLETELSEKETVFNDLSDKYNKIVEEQNRKKVEAVFENFEEDLSGDNAFESLKEKYTTVCDEVDVTALENECFSILGRKKANFSAKKGKENHTVKLAFSTETKEKEVPYGGLFEKFAKHN